MCAVPISRPGSRIVCKYRTIAATGCTLATLADIASVFRSKNAEPFLTTIDIFFANMADYHRAKDSGSITLQSVAKQYNYPIDAVYGVYFLDSIGAIKVTLYKRAGGRYVGQGDPELSDMFGAQQHVPLTCLVID